MRIAFKLAYFGTNYYGFQIQPDVPTIESELFGSLKKMGIIDDPKSANYSGSGRTDRGVHSIGQVIAFDSDRPGLAIPRIINSELPGGIWVWARAEVPEDFDARRDAISREYRYFFYGKSLNLPKIRSASRLLIGTHDFANFSVNEGKSTVRTIKSVEVRVDGDFLFLDVVADSFARYMVRKIVTALTMIGSGVRNAGWLTEMLDPEEHIEGIESAPAYGLVLKDVCFGNKVAFIEDDYAKKKAIQSLHKEFLWHGTMHEILKEMEYELG
ncbi:MAG: tRNA pseudouridine(38-40) synthase TruA [Halobacteriota archaeon]|nr:tRNA pseudouridine(38-40) synthase TruA [Halobacteriota archaeon]